MNTEKMIRVGIFKLGNGPVHTARLERLLSALTGPYHFEVGTSITNLGPPDLHGYGYSDDAIVSAISPHADAYDVAVAITIVPIEDNYFTRRVGGRFIISTTYQAEMLMQSSGRSPEEYVALAICQELVNFEFCRVTGKGPQDDLFHKDPRGCLFDFAGIKEQKIGKLKSCSICQDCLGKLAETNADQYVIDFAKRLLRKVRSPSLGKALRLSVSSPGISFLFGGCTNFEMIRTSQS